MGKLVTLTQGIMDRKHREAHLAGYDPVRAMMLLNEEVVYPGKSVWEVAGKAFRSGRLEFEFQLCQLIPG